MFPLLTVDNVAKSFTLHNQGGAVISAFAGVSFDVRGGETLVLTGSSGAGKSTLLRILYANYRPSSGTVCVRHFDRYIDLASAPARTIIEARRHSLGWVSQFLRVIPRVSTIEIVKDPMLRRGIGEHDATDRAQRILSRLGISSTLWNLAPATFSGGEQQRVNIARTMVDPPPVLLLDEPTASLDNANRNVVVDLIKEACAAGSAIVGIFHDEAVRGQVATRTFDLTAFRQA